MIFKSPFYNDMCSLVWIAFENLYPGKKVFCEWTPELEKFEDGKDVLGLTHGLDDGSYYVQVLTKLPVEDATEILAHELAHVAVGIEHNHDAVWEKAFDDIFNEYNRVAEEIFDKENFDFNHVDVVSGKDYVRHEEDSV